MRKIWAWACLDAGHVLIPDMSLVDSQGVVGRLGLFESCVVCVKKEEGPADSTSWGGVELAWVVWLFAGAGTFGGVVDGRACLALGAGMIGVAKRRTDLVCLLERQKADQTGATFCGACAFVADGFLSWAAVDTRAVVAVCEEAELSAWTL